MAQVLVITRLTFREAARRWVLWAAILLGLVFLIVFGLGFAEIERSIQREMERVDLSLGMAEFHNFFVMAGLYVVNFLVVMMTVLTSVDTLSGEIASGTIHTLVSKPLRRWEIVVGKWLGFCGMLTGYLLLMDGGVLMVVYAISGYLPQNIIPGFFMLWLNMMVLLSISFFGGTILSTLTNGVFVFGLYGIAFIGGWIEQFGSLMNNDTAIQIGIISSLLMPGEALWKRAAFEMQSSLISAFGGMTPFVALSVPSIWMIVFAIFYVGALIMLAISKFQTKDL